MEKSRFEEKVLPILHYIGTIGALLMSIAYITIVCVMIFGFNLIGKKGVAPFLHKFIRPIFHICLQAFTFYLII